MAGLQPIKLGDKVRPAQIERFKGTKGSKDIISILSREIDVARIHYIPGMGYIYCFDGVCCEQVGIPMYRYIIPIVQYTGTIGKFGEPVYLKYMALSRETYEEDIMVKDELKKDITRCDIVAICTDEKYQKMNYEALDGSALWQKNENIKNFLREEIKSYKRLIGLSVARTVSEEKFLQFFESNPTASNMSMSSGQSSSRGGGSGSTSRLSEGQRDKSSSLQLSTGDVKEEKEVSSEPVTPEDFKFDDLLGE